MYRDTFFANNADLSSQLGYNVFLSDNTDKCQAIVWLSHKGKRVTTSVLGTQVMAFSDVFGVAYSFKVDMEMML